MATTVTVNDVLDGHVGLDLDCIDRIYLNGYVPNLQVSGQVASLMTAHLDYTIPSPAILDKIGTAFRRAVDRFAEDNRIPVVREVVIVGIRLRSSPEVQWVERQPVSSEATRLPHA
jgi:hypothetical protein